jgi:hypothetical protein
MPASIANPLNPTNSRALQAMATRGPHPLVAQACRVGAPGTVRSSGRSVWGLGDPDRMVVVSCLVSFVVMPFLL